ncbi:hypothetical protein K438DRAFT_1994322 [Mycena galopus ATCC 62051]|nr:hypothetical protein K438DRAFT_1994322 [Mycena galopus ATCC 62051]
MPSHYSGKIAYGNAHQEGAMAFAARQAWVRQRLATRFRRLWCRLSDRIQGPEAAASSESSGAEEQDVAFDEGDSGSSGDEPDAAESVDPAAPGQRSTAQDGAELEEHEHAGGDEEGKDQEDDEEAEDGEDGQRMSRQEVDSRRAVMDDLLAAQAASLELYNEI